MEAKWKVKTTLKQVLRGENITYKKTQYVSQYDCVIDMPGEYDRPGFGAYD